MSLWLNLDDLELDVECRLVSGPQEPTNFPSSASRADGLAWGVVFVVEILGEGSLSRHSSSPFCWSVLRSEACYLQDSPVDVSPGTDAIAASRAILLKEAAAWRCCRPRRRQQTNRPRAWVLWLCTQRGADAFGASSRNPFYTTIYSQSLTS